MPNTQPPPTTPQRPDVRGLLTTGVKEAGTLLGKGLLSFLATVALLALVGFPLALLCAALIPESFWWRLLAAVLVLLVFAVEAWFLGLQRACATMIVTAVRRFQMASRALGLLFDTMEKLLGERSINKVERLPLRQAETTLRQALAPLAGNVESAGWFRRYVVGWVHRRLLKLVGLLTLAEFRRADAENGGIELDAARTRLAAKLDHLVEKHVLGGVRKLTWLVLGITVVVLLALTIAIRSWRLHAHSALPPFLPPAATAPATMPATAPTTVPTTATAPIGNPASK